MWNQCTRSICCYIHISHYWSCNRQLCVEFGIMLRAYLYSNCVKNVNGVLAMQSSFTCYTFEMHTVTGEPCKSREILCNQLYFKRSITGFEIDHFINISVRIEVGQLVDDFIEFVKSTFSLTLCTWPSNSPFVCTRARTKEIYRCEEKTHTQFQFDGYCCFVSRNWTHSHTLNLSSQVSRWHQMVNAVCVCICNWI